MKSTLTVVKSFLFVYLALSFIPSVHIYSQACYNPFVEYVISQTNIDSICRVNRELTGDTITIIGGLPYLIYSRVYDSPANDKAAQYIMEKFTGWGMQARYQRYSESGKNVIAVMPGVKYPEKQFIICAHYDNATMTPYDTTYGADDNASGVCGVLEAARILRQYTFDYTIIFIAFDEEERWMFGSYAYVDSAYERGDSILGVINLDMIAFDSDDDYIMNIRTDSNSRHLNDVIFSSCRIYQPVLKPELSYGGASDHLPFWEKGYKASCIIEDNNDFNWYYHTIDEKYDKLNPPFMHAIIKAAIASLIVFENDFIIDFTHDPIASTFDTTSQTATVIIRSKHRIAYGSNRPRLYYKTASTGYNYVNAYYNSQDTFKFMIPGFAAGTTVNYYLAAQDSAQTMIGTSPGGGMGLSPPGTIPPPGVYTYYILETFNICSFDLPKSIAPHKIVYDSIYVGMDKIIHDIDVKVSIRHIKDEDLYIYLLRAGEPLTYLSLNNGGTGSDYINTIFDDEADTSITEGTPPFTGHYRPEAALTKYDGSNSSGYWMLRILNMSNTDTAQLTEWCMDISHFNPIGITQNQLPARYELSQNYPNPFNAMTKIRYNLLKAGNVKLTIYDVLGREVKVLVNGTQKTGRHEISWDASGMASGLYIYRLVHPNFAESKKMVLIK